MKKWTALFLAMIMMLSCLAGCGGSDEPETPETPETPDAPAEGGEVESENVDPLSGIPYSEDTEYTYIYSSEITSLNYLATSIASNLEPIANFIDTLVEYDQYGSVVPCLAKSWECSEDGLTWTFHLRDDAKWFDCDGNEVAPVTAHDFVYGARLVANPLFNSDMPDMLIRYIANGLELYNGAIDDYTQLGVEAQDDYTLVYHLRAPCAYFVTMLTYGCYMPVLGEYYESLAVENPIPVIKDDGTEGDPITNEFGTDRDKILYNGAYLCSSWQPQEEFVWVKNENYYDAEHVYITVVDGVYNAQADALAPEMYLRGEIDGCTVSTSILDDWMKGENAQYVHPTVPGGFIQYMMLCFDPHHDDEAAGANYKKAVNNKNFRLSIATGMDKAYSISAYDPNNAKDLVSNLLVPPTFAVAPSGKDYTQMGKLAELGKGMFDEEKALAYRDAAKEELTAEGVNFPVQIPLYYCPANNNQDQACQLIEKQLESLLGNDYIEITVIAGPATNFISEVRAPGIWGLLEGGWGPDYADPASYFEPFSYGWTYGMQDKIEGDEYKTGYIYTQEDYDKGLITKEELIGQPQLVFNAMQEAANAETQDLEKRYELYADAEAFALEEGLVIPYRRRNNGYKANNMTIFDGQRAMSGICSNRYKGRHMLEKSYSTEEYYAAKEAWETAMAAR